MQVYRSGQEAQRDQSNAWVTAADILMEESGDLVIIFELPGVSQESIDLSLSGGDLTVCGEKDGREGVGEYYTHERYFGFFRRTISLSDSLTHDRISTTFDAC